MDHELKQRLIGAVVVTALAAIFIPMLFDDPVDTTGKTVTELAIPQAPANPGAETAQQLPDSKSAVLEKGDTELSVSEDEAAEQPADSAGVQPENSAETAMPPQAGQTVTDSELKAGEEDMAAKDAEQNSEPELDTGVVDEPAHPDKPTVNAAPPVDPIPSKPKPVIEKPVKKLVSAEKPKVKTASVTEKSKTASKPEQIKAKKTDAKLVRYSIQAGSFSKKENAQALVEKLRKQGLPATLSTKGNLYRVKIGPELDKKKATDMKAKLDKQNINSLITSE